MSQLGEMSPSTHDSVWIATTILHKENNDRDIFSVSEIFNKIKELGIIKVSDTSIKQHISSHCVANTYASPDNHRYLYRVDTGKYRLFRPGDGYVRDREGGKTVPITEVIPHKFRELIEWYQNDYCKRKMPFQETSPIITTPSYVRIDEDCKIIIPKKILDNLMLRIGDHVGFIEGSDGRIQLQKMKVMIQPQ